MGLFNTKSKDKVTREVGSDFDEKEANEIFDIMDKLDAGQGKKLSEKMKNEANLSKEISSLLSEAKKTNSCELFEKVLVLQPENAEAYQGLVDIYRTNGDRDSEVRVLKLAISNIDSNSKIKNNLMQRLKQIT